MATIGKRNGILSIRFIFPPRGRRHTIALGTRSEKQAETFKRCVENLIASRSRGFLPDPQTLAWVGQLSDELIERLSMIGLIERANRESSTTLDSFIRDYER